MKMLGSAAGVSAARAPVPASFSSSSSPALPRSSWPTKSGAAITAQRSERLCATRGAREVASQIPKEEKRVLNPCVWQVASGRVAHKSWERNILAGASRTRVNMSHSGPFRCMCGQIHADQFDGPSNDLLPYIDLTSVTALNAVGDGAEAARRIFKPFDQRFERDPCLESEEDDPQLIIRVPFTSPVQIRAFTLIGGGDGQAPRTARFFLNHESLDFSDAEDGRPVQAWDLVEDPIGAVEYPTQFSKFQNVSVLCIFIPDNHGADHTSLSYL